MEQEKSSTMVSVFFHRHWVIFFCIAVAAGLFITSQWVATLVEQETLSSTPAQSVTVPGEDAAVLLHKKQQKPPKRDPVKGIYLTA